MRGGHRRQIDVDQHVAVHHEEGVGADDREGVSRAAGASEDRRLFPRVAKPRAQIAAITECGGHRCGQMMEVRHEIGDAVCRQPSHDAPGERFTRDGNGRLCADHCQRPQASAEAGREQERVSEWVHVTRIR